MAVDEAKTMAEEGTDVVLAHLDVTTIGPTAATKAMILEEAPAMVHEICHAAKSFNPAEKGFDVAPRNHVIT